MSRNLRREALTGWALENGLVVRIHAPGDGATRYRFFRHSDVVREGRPGFQLYDGPAEGIFTALGIAEAETWLRGFSAGRDSR